MGKNSSSKTKNISKKQKSSSKFKKRNREPKKKHTWKSVRDKKKSRTLSSEPDNQKPSSTSLPRQQQDHGSNPGGGSKPDTSLRTRMLERLNIAKFRTINSTQTPSTELKNLKTFKTYHSALTSTSQTWKSNPLDTIITWATTTLPKTHIVADLGCGSAKLQSSIPQKTLSYDLHALNNSVTQADIRNLPLPQESVHVVVFCLSLMETNITDYIAEAWRILKRDGLLKIGEVSGRIGSLDKFNYAMKTHGFRFVTLERVGGDDVFVVVEYKKVGKKGGQRDRAVTLESVVYKKR